MIEDMFLYYLYSLVNYDEGLIRKLYGKIKVRVLYVEVFLVFDILCIIKI